MAETLGDDWTTARALNTLGYTANVWDGPNARELLERSIALGRSLDDDWVVADGLKMLTIEAIVREDLDDLDRVIGDLRDVAAKLGNEFFLAWCEGADGIVAMHRGEFEAARSHLESSIALCRVVGDPATGGIATAWLSELEARIGDHVGARARIEEFVAHANATGGHLGVGHSLLALCEILLGTGDPGSAATLAGALAANFAFPVYVMWAGTIHGAALPRAR